jgi:hypothetical protein
MFQAENDTNGRNRLLFDELFGLGYSDPSDTDEEVPKNCSCRKYTDIIRAFQKRNWRNYLQKK